MGKKILHGKKNYPPLPSPHRKNAPKESKSPEKYPCGKTKDKILPSPEKNLPEKSKYPGQNPPASRLQKQRKEKKNYRAMIDLEDGASALAGRCAESIINLLKINDLPLRTLASSGNKPLRTGARSSREARNFL